jgi:hypothetical protein
MSRKPVRRKKRSLEEIFLEWWIEETRKGILDSAESSEIDKSNCNFSRLFKLVIAYRCFEEVAWE